MATTCASSAPTLLFGTALVPVHAIDHQAAYVVSTAPVSAAPAHCPRCGHPLNGNGTRVLTALDLPLHERTVTLKIPVALFRCRRCGKTDYLRPADLHPGRQMTARLVRYIERAGLERPYAEIAQEVGVCAATVAEICGAHIARLDADYRPDAPAALSIDGVHIRKRKEYGVLSDHDAFEVIDILPDAKMETVRDGLRRLRHPRRCRVVTMDMCAYFRDTVRQELPGALIVIDKWHVCDLARRCMIAAIRPQHRQLAEPRSLTLLALRGAHGPASVI